MNRERVGVNVRMCMHMHACAFMRVRVWGACGRACVGVPLGALMCAHLGALLYVYARAYLCMDVHGYV